MEKYFCEVGSIFNKTKKVKYLSTQTFLDYDAVILTMSIEGILKEADNHNGAAFEKRKEDLQEFLSHKKTPLIVFAPQEYERYFHGYGTVEFDFFIPVDTFSVMNETGNSIEVVSKTIFSDFLKKYQPNFFYRSYFSEYNGIPIAKARHTGKVLAYYNDSVVFLPTIKNITGVENEFLDDLFYIISQLNKKTFSIELPEWAKDYHLPKEKEVITEVIEIEAQIERFSEQLVQKKERIQEFESRKQIFTGSGDCLEEEIKTMFKEIGFEILESEPSRDDIAICTSSKQSELFLRDSFVITS